MVKIGVVLWVVLGSGSFVWLSGSSVGPGRVVVGSGLVVVGRSGCSLVTFQVVSGSGSGLFVVVVVNGEGRVVDNVRIEEEMCTTVSGAWGP